MTERLGLGSEWAQHPLVRNSTVAVGIVTIALGACAAPRAQGEPEAPPVVAEAPVPRPRPPIAARNCASLAEEEKREASEYLQKISRYSVLHDEDTSDAVQQRDIAGEPGPPVGVILYLPAERGMNRSYLERLLYCHAVTPPSPMEHPNDPLLAPGIVEIEVRESDGGEYQVRIMVGARGQVDPILQRTRALEPSTGSIEVRQVETTDQSASP